MVGSKSVSPGAGLAYGASMVAILAGMVVANVIYPELGGLIGKSGMGGRPLTWVITLGLFAAALLFGGWLVKGRWDGIFIDEDNHISLSRLQLVVWTVVLVSALMSAGLSNAALHYPKPLEIIIPPTIWGLLGIGSFSFVAAGVINARLRDAKILQAADEPSWLDLIRGEDGNVEIGKMQQLAFTVMLVTIYVSGLYDMMAHAIAGGASPKCAPSVPCSITAFPQVDGGFVALLGVSHAAYLATKQAKFGLKEKTDPKPRAGK